MACSICKTSWGSAQRKEESLTYHRIPKRDEALRKKWLDFVGRRTSSAKVETMRICSRHFEPKCFRKQAFCSLLKRGSVPTLCPPSEVQGRRQVVEVTSNNTSHEEESQQICKNEQVEEDATQDSHEYIQSTPDIYVREDTREGMVEDSNEPEQNSEQHCDSGLVIQEISDGHEPVQNSPSLRTCERRQDIKQEIEDVSDCHEPEESSLSDNDSEQLSFADKNAKSVMNTLLQAIKLSSGPSDSKRRMTVLIPIGTTVKNSSVDVKERHQIKCRLKRLETQKEKDIARIKELASHNKKLRYEVKRLRNRKPKPPSVEEICGHLRGKVSDTFVSLLYDQLRNCDKSPSGRRWSENTRELALSVYKSSPVAYKKLCASMHLPSSRIVALHKAQSLMVSSLHNVDCCIQKVVESYLQEEGECCSQEELEPCHQVEMQCYSQEEVESSVENLLASGS